MKHAKTQPTVPENILAIDIGTTSVRAGVITPGLQILALAARPLSITQPQPNCVEQDGDAILRATEQAIEEVLDGCRTNPTVAALAIQRSTVIAWNAENGRAITPALSWQDTRMHSVVAALKIHGTLVKQKSGLVLSPHYGASKMAWLHNNAKHKNALVAPLVSFILFNLLENSPFICDESNACRTQLYNIHNRRWSRKLSEIFNVPLQSLPKVVHSHQHFGKMKYFGCPLNHVCGDQNAAFTALQQANPGTAVANFGTGAFLLAEGSPQSNPPLLTSIIGSDNRNLKTVIEATINGAGAALDWLREQWQKEVPQTLPLHHYYQALESALYNQTTPPIFVNAVGGLGSPWWNTNVTPYFESTPTSHTGWPAKGLAVMESIAFLVYANLQVINKTRDLAPIKQLNCAGGLMKISGFSQMLANAIEIPVAVCEDSEATLLGLAVHCGYKNTLRFRLYEPAPETTLRERRDTLLKRLSERTGTTH